jgi:PKD repeat protein
MKSTVLICITISVLLCHCFFHSQCQTVLTLQPGPNEGIDATLASIFPTTNFWDSPGFLAAAWTFNGEFGIDRGLLKFDLTQIPASAIIIDAKLSLYYWEGPNNGHYGENVSYLQKVIENWDEMTVTWDNQPSATTAGEVYLPSSYIQTQDYLDINLTQFVSDWVSDPQNNFGMFFRNVVEVEYASMLFASSDNSTASLRPKLVVTYRTCSSLVADFSYIVNGSNVQFADSSSSADSWYWDFGDGYYSDHQNPVHSYMEPGKYYACLSVTDSCGSAQYCDTVYYCDPPNPHFSYLVNGNLVTFTDSSTSPITWFWSFGDNFYSDLQNPTHYYKNAGTYYVCLTSTNSCYHQTFCDSIIFQPNGIQTIKREDFSLYPVPAIDHLNLEWLYPIPGSGEIDMVNSQGSVVFKKQITLTSSCFHDILGIQDLSPGLYYLRVVTSNVSLLKKFIVIKTF